MRICNEVGFGRGIREEGNYDHSTKNRILKDLTKVFFKNRITLNINIYNVEKISTYLRMK